MLMYSRLKLLPLLLIPTIGFATPQAALERNQTPHFAKQRWFENVQISGLLVGELIYSDTDQRQSGRFTVKDSYSTFCFPRANLFIDSQVNDWLNGHLAFNFRSTCGFGGKNDPWRFVKFGVTDEAYITVANPKLSPWFARVGIQYMPYGNYPRHMIPASLPQLMTQTQAAGIYAGYAPDTNLGWQGGVYLFDGRRSENATNRVNNGGFTVSYRSETDTMNYLLQGDYMYNTAGAVNYVVHDTTTTNPSNSLRTSYRNTVSGLALTAKLDTAALYASFQAAFSLGKFHQDDVLWQSRGASPNALSFMLGHKHTGPWLMPAKAQLSYQRSSEAVNLRGAGTNRGLPKHRLQADYTVELVEDLHLGGHLIWDKDYRIDNGGLNRSSTTAVLSMHWRVA